MFDRCWSLFKAMKRVRQANEQFSLYIGHTFIGEHTMMHQSVHMRDQKANQFAMRSRQFRQAAINMLEEITVLAVLWGLYLLTSPT